MDTDDLPESGKRVVTVEEKSDDKLDMKNIKRFTEYEHMISVLFPPPLRFTRRKQYTAQMFYTVGPPN